MILHDWWGVACARVKRTGRKKGGRVTKGRIARIAEVSAEDEDERKVGRMEEARGRGCDGRARKGGGGEGEDPARSRYDPAERGRASVEALPSVVEPTLSRALCPVLVGISGAPTGPSAVSPII